MRVGACPKWVCSLLVGVCSFGCVPMAPFQLGVGESATGKVVVVAIVKLITYQYLCHLYLVEEKNKQPLHYQAKTIRNDKNKHK